MVVFVDDVFIEATVPNGSRAHASKWCHLSATTKDELHAFAQSIGLRRSWFQDKPGGHWHYDVTLGLRAKAIKAGAISIGHGTEEFERYWHAPGREGVDAQDLSGKPDAVAVQQDRPSRSQARTRLSIPGWLDDWTGADRIWSNYAPVPASYEGVEYPTGEHAFAAAKSLDLEIRRRIRDAASPGEAKRLGGPHGIVTLRPGWNDTVRYEAMREVVATKFAAGTDAAARLLATDDHLLIEANTHHDQHWGRCRCDKHRSWPGTNHLGRMLVAHRSLLRNEPEGTWTRVACTGHRPQHMTADQIDWAEGQLQRVATKLIAERGMRIAIHGGANGADRMWAHAAHHAGVDALWAYLPFPQQADKWGPVDRADWELCRTARMDGGIATKRWTLGDHYDAALLHARNDAMLHDCDLLIAVHEPAKTTGGTASAMTKARSRRIPMLLMDLQALTVRVATYS